jgi:carbon monoxide dehydrogenase subunit G
MEMTGEQIIPAAQAEVWRGLNDPEILKACITGCESIEKLTGTEYAIVTIAAIGPVKAKFRGKLLLADLDPPNSYSLSFDGQGGAAGFGKGSAKVSLAAEGAGTRLSYAVKAQVGGKLAQIGSRLIDGVAKKLADDFFAAFNRKMAGPVPLPRPRLARRRCGGWWPSSRPCSCSPIAPEPQRARPPAARRTDPPAPCLPI